MSNSAIALIGGLSLVAIGVSVKKKIENLENQIKLLNSRISSLINENNELRTTLRNKDSEILQKNKENEQLKTELKKIQKHV